MGDDDDERNRPVGAEAAAGRPAQRRRDGVRGGAEPAAAARDAGRAGAGGPGDLGAGDARSTPGWPRWSRRRGCRSTWGRPRRVTPRWPRAEGMGRGRSGAARRLAGSLGAATAAEAEAARGWQARSCVVRS
ncbi:hypothetical protein BAE44_0004999 [Dichanthelium oligosanthes]|uniref:Uncharacterized protein n=1 Tax=Dichanthelium oligosanthes TaxID=888268 RepID=A0A1E5W9C0_9POAL|nr:hypothetical protein BAE44_0004999 [Dichanthelium oligosanthes]